MNNEQVSITIMFYMIITNTMAYWYDGAALAATRSPVIALFWCLIKFTTTATTTTTMTFSKKPTNAKHINKISNQFCYR